MANKSARTRAFWAGAVVAGTTALLGGLASSPAQAHWVQDLDTCKRAYGSEVYLAWEIPTVVLAKGSSGVCVRGLQDALLEAGAVRAEDQPGFVDGSFGPKTYNAVVAFQSRAGVTGGADGVVGRYTWHHLIATVGFE
ncbi:peptidoglycan-binding domain-containing protein [Streptomyces venezuelae]|uniref:peptidoglycan-binding domain-containing protein n=1 Tax=Streptomyces venezuelae TaxID=54571 RepID=UPI00278BFAFA|nr:peptidoglycan-binding protein [Streptomyces venezuelae]